MKIGYNPFMKKNKWYQRPFLALFLFVVLSVPISTWLALPKKEVDEFFNKTLLQLEEEVLVKYPDDLEIEIDDGLISVNKELPYCLELDEEQGVKQGIVFDKKPNISALMEGSEEYSQLCKPIVLVGENYVIWPDRQGLKTQPISNEINIDIDKNKINEWASKIMPVIKDWGMKAYMFGPILLVGPAMLVLMFLNLWYGMVLKIACSLFKIRKIDFSLAYRTSLIVFTAWNTFKWLVSMIIRQISETGIRLSPFPFFDTTLITAICLLLIKNKTVDFGEKISEKRGN